MKKIILLLFSLLVFTACERKENDELQIISVDNTQIKDLSLDSKVNTEILTLESSTNAFFRNVKNIFIVNDTIVMYGFGKVSAFDKSGKYLFDYGTKGQGPEEYISLSNVFIKDGAVFILDGQGRKVLKYTPSGKFIETFKINLEKYAGKMGGPTSMIPIPDTDNYMSTPTFMGGGDELRTPLLGLYNKDFNPVAFSTELQQSSWTNGSFPLVAYTKGTMLYNAPLSYNIFVVKEDLIPVIKYKVDFGKDAVPARLHDQGAAAIYEAIFAKSDDLKDKCLFINFINSTKDKIIFTYQFDETPQIASFDKGSDKTMLFTPTLSDKYKLQSFIKVIDKKVYMIAEDLDDTEANFSIVTFDLSAL